MTETKPTNGLLTDRLYNTRTKNRLIWLTIDGSTPTNDWWQTLHTCKMRVLAQLFLQPFPEPRHPPHPGVRGKAARKAASRTLILHVCVSRNSTTIKTRERSSETVTSAINRHTNSFSWRNARTDYIQKCAKIFFVLNTYMHSLYADMAAARYSFDVLQTSNCQLSEAIQNLPPELRETIYKEYLAIKRRQRKEMGWDEVHDEIEEAPICEKRSRIGYVMFCRNATLAT